MRFYKMWSRHEWHITPAIGVIGFPGTTVGWTIWFCWFGFECGVQFGY